MAYSRIGVEPVAFVIASVGANNSKLLFPNLKNFRIFRNPKSLQPEIIHYTRLMPTMQLKTN
ncbi:hypothetical protein LEP1GSC137_3999 [Leptospira borgpetersenii str. Noumea 25]|uniref:Uncharacterized protein n=2 Tax=Leptospira borgpetersenii TaxID=174 RepID=M3HUZ2_LEPBO|nr:hypothetical protein LEP1GSC123_0238 [Leptospira borgpetersenii str. 200701203]EMN15569.1 hypothetical protein LEP1GSC056_3521 [Leptospira borgpetersenii str. Brem 328]EMO10561.1 hypothetical protein LEP1GSC137_3999 [Leptospira borgpetersenii str. Noumea 25]